MNKELLDEFLIIQYGDNYAISITDKAYDLLKLKDKEEILPNGAYVKTISDWYYRVAFLNFLSNNYHIDGLVRESRGNSHDNSWLKEILIFNNGGLWCNELNSYRTQEKSTYESKPKVLDKEKITNDLIENWANEYDVTGDGEERDGRLVFCSYADGSERFCFSFESSFIVGTSTSKNYSKKVHYDGIYLKRRTEN